MDKILTPTGWKSLNEGVNPIKHILRGGKSGLVMPKGERARLKSLDLDAKAMGGAFTASVIKGTLRKTGGAKTPKAKLYDQRADELIRQMKIQTRMKDILQKRAEMKEEASLGTQPVRYSERTLWKPRKDPKKPWLQLPKKPTK